MVVKRGNFPLWPSLMRLRREDEGRWGCWEKREVKNQISACNLKWWSLKMMMVMVIMMMMMTMTIQKNIFSNLLLYLTRSWLSCSIVNPFNIVISCPKEDFHSSPSNSLPLFHSQPFILPPCAEKDVNNKQKNNLASTRRVSQYWFYAENGKIRESIRATRNE